MAECTPLGFLNASAFTATPNSGEARLKVVFKTLNDPFDRLVEAPLASVDRRIIESPCTNYRIIE